MMYQSLHRDSCIKAWCEIVSHDTEKFDEANDTLNDGLGIEFRPGQFQHFGAPLFKRGDYALLELEHLQQRHQDVAELNAVISRLRPRASAKEADGVSLTLSNEAGQQRIVESNRWRRR